MSVQAKGSRLVFGLSLSISVGRLPGIVRAQDITELPSLVVEGAALEAKRRPRAVKSTSNEGAAAATTSTSAESQPVETSASGDETDGLQIRKVASRVSVIAREQLVARQVRNAAEAFTAAGVFRFSDNHRSMATFS